MIAGNYLTDQLQIINYTNISSLCHTQDCIKMVKEVPTLSTRCLQEWGIEILRDSIYHGAMIVLGVFFFTFVADFLMRGSKNDIIIGIRKTLRFIDYATASMYCFWVLSIWWGW